VHCVACFMLACFMLCHVALPCFSVSVITFLLVVALHNILIFIYFFPSYLIPAVQTNCEHRYTQLLLQVHVITDGMQGCACGDVDVSVYCGVIKLLYVFCYFLSALVNVSCRPRQATSVHSPLPAHYILRRIRAPSLSRMNHLRLLCVLVLTYSTNQGYYRRGNK
jgi:hypothetical protein